MSVEVVIRQHAEDAADLHNVRSVLVRSPHVQLHRLLRTDERLTAHLDGLLIAGQMGLQACRAALEQPAPGAVFTAVICAIELENRTLLDQCIALCEAAPEGS